MQLPSCFFFFFFNDTATTEIYTLSLHDALPIWLAGPRPVREGRRDHRRAPRQAEAQGQWSRSEEHTSELQSQSNLVCRLLLEKKKTYAASRRFCNTALCTRDGIGDC